MHAIFTLIQAIPNVVWSGIIASILTLSGVLLSNRSSTHRLNIQLQHDATEKAKERMATLRRETYLNAAEELVRMNVYLASLPQVDITKANASDGMQGFFTSAARLQLVAEPKTAFLVNQLSAGYAELLILLMGALRPVADAKSEIDIAKAMYDQSQVEINRLTNDLSKQYESGQPNQKIIQVLQASFDFQLSQSAKFESDRSIAWSRFNRSSAHFQKVLLTEIRDLGFKQIPVMIEIRRDLGLTGDLQEMEAFMRAQWKKMEAQLDALLASLGDDQAVNPS